MKKIIEQDRWVMLPTNDIEHVIIEKNTGLLLLQTKSKEFSGTKNHLYLTSDEEIKEGDWFINHDGLWKHNGVIEPSKTLSKKIIATTDKSLTECDGCKRSKGIEGSIYTCSCSGIMLPQIPESFIKYYVEKQGKVGDVEALLADVYAHGIVDVNYRPKLLLTDNNEIIIDIIKERGITITKVEEKMYSRDEVASKIQKHRLYALKFGLEANITNRWVNENL